MENIDNFSRTYKLETAFDGGEVLFYNVKKDPFSIHGLYDPIRQPTYRRLPEPVANATNAGVAQLNFDTAGGRVRFSTDSPFIVVKIVMPRINRFPHMPLTGTAGIDIYEDSDGGSHFLKAAKPEIDITDGYEFSVKLQGTKMRSFTVNFPPYNPVDAIFIGLSETARVTKARPYANKKPIVFYGSSITQGACVSRPGMIYESIISRRYNLDYTNLGFSGSARAEAALVSYMARLPMLAFVSDYDHNSPNVDHLRETHSRMYDAIREQNPDVPYIMLSRPDFSGTAKELARRDVVIDTYRRARELGDKNVYYIDGEGLFSGPMSDNCTVDGTHPNDLGMTLIADRLGRVIDRALRNIDLGGNNDE